MKMKISINFTDVQIRENEKVASVEETRVHLALVKEAENLLKANGIWKDWPFDLSVWPDDDLRKLIQSEKRGD